MGHYVITLPWGFRSSVYSAVVEAENRHGRPVTRNEIYIVHKQTSYLKLFVMIVAAILADMYRNDELLADREQCYWSVNEEN